MQANSESIKADLQAAREENCRQRHDYDKKIGELVRGQERLREQVQAAQGKLEDDAAEYEKRIAELQKALEAKQEEVVCAAQESHKDELERLLAPSSPSASEPTEPRGRREPQSFCGKTWKAARARSVPCGSSFRCART